jgi:hypothetical protein
MTVAFPPPIVIVVDVARVVTTIAPSVARARFTRSLAPSSIDRARRPRARRRLTTRRTTDGTMHADRPHHARHPSSPSIESIESIVG